MEWHLFERNKNRVAEALANTPVGKMLDQLAFAVAVAKAIHEYISSRNGAPIVSDDDASVIETWRGVRLEVISELWRYNTPPEFLVDPTQHPKFLYAIIERTEQSHLRPKNPTGNEVDDTISAILRMYDRLEKLDFDVSSPYLQVGKDDEGYVSPYAGLIQEMRKLHLKWQGFMWAIKTKSDLPPQPDTVFMALWRDVTYRSKIIALCARLGPSYLPNFARAKELVLKGGESTANLDNLMVQVLTADDPDHL